MPSRRAHLSASAFEMVLEGLRAEPVAHCPPSGPAALPLGRGPLSSCFTSFLGYWALSQKGAQPCG